MTKFRDISFSTMRKMDISTVFTKWIKLLFTGATGCNIYLNDNSGENFKVENGYDKCVRWHLTFSS